MKTETYKATQSLVLENSFGTIAEQKDVQLEVNLTIKSDDYGFFEFYDIEDEQGWYAEGGIWFEGKTVKDYDGVFALPPFITDKLKEWGYDTSDVE